MFNNAVSCVACDMELFTSLSKYTKDGKLINWIADPKKFNPHITPINLPKEKFVIFSPQRIGLDKGSEIIWEALRKCKTDFKVLQVNWVHDESEYSEINKKLLQNIPNYVEFIPKIPRVDLPRYYAFADAILGQMKIGILSNIEREAALCKKPVICYNDPKFYTKLKNKKLNSPFLPKSQDPNDIALLIDKIVKDKKFREELAEREYNFILEITNPENAIKEWENLFFDLYQTYDSINSKHHVIKSFFRVITFLIFRKIGKILQLYK